MKYKLAVALAIAAIMVLSVIPMVSDEADAHVINEKDAGVGFSVNNLSGDTLKKIFSQERQNGAAEYILTMMIKDNSDNYEITEVEVTDYDAAVYMGSSISGNVVNTVDSESLSYKITFKATRTSAPQGQLFFNEYQNAAIIKEVGLDNMSQEGAVFEVTSYLEFVLSYHTKYTYETNSAEDFVLTHKWEQYYNKQAVKYDVNTLSTTTVRRQSHTPMIAEMRSQNARTPAWISAVWM